MLIIMCKGNEVNKVKTQIYKVQSDMMVDHVTCGEQKSTRRARILFINRVEFINNLSYILIESGNINQF